MHHSVHSEKSNLLSWVIRLVFADLFTYEGPYFNVLLTVNFHLPISIEITKFQAIAIFQLLEIFSEVIYSCYVPLDQSSKSPDITEKLSHYLNVTLGNNTYLLRKGELHIK